MVDNNVNMVVDRLSIGNGFVSSLLTLVKNLRLTGGIKRYTLRRGYYLNNISNNFEGGKVGRYGYGNYLDASARDKIDGTDGVKLDGEGLTPATLYQDKIGDFYSTNFRPQNSEMPFYTVEDFSLLGQLLRNKNFTRTNTVSSSIGLLGHEISTYITAKPSTEVYEGEIAPTSPRLGKKTFSSHADFGAEFLHTLSGVGATVREKYKYLRIVNPVVDARNDKTTMSGGKQESNYGDIYSVADVLSDITTGDMVFNELTPEGIFDYSRNEEKRRELQIYGKQYTYSNSYGVSYKYSDEDEPKYVLPENGLSKYFAASSHTIDRKYVGSLRVTRNNGKNVTHEYFSEVDMGSPVRSLISTNTMDGFVPYLMPSTTSTTRLLDKTNSLFRKDKIKSLINRFHTDVADDLENDELVTAYKKNYGLSRGRNLLRKAYENTTSGDKSSGFDNPYCRVWTAHHQYSKLKDRIRPFMDGSNFMSIKDLQANYGNMRPNGTILSDYTTLQDNGFVKISPYKDSTLDKDDLKKYMFSIENLAWKGFANDKNLSKEQQGPNGGRIMWFPPYNLKFQENINTSWRDNEFIGRGEKIYTYANTERGGTLSFTLLIDHPSIINKWASKISQPTDEQEQDLLRFFAGCGPLTVDEEPPIIPKVTKFEEEDNKEDTTPRPRPDKQYYYENFVIFFPNNFSAKKYYSNMSELFKKLDDYEMSSDGVETFKEMDDAYSHEILAKYNYDNLSLFSLNTTEGLSANRAEVVNMLGIDEDVKSYEEFKRLTSLYNDKSKGSSSIFGHDSRDYEIDSIVLNGFASDHGYASNNQTLSRDRATTIGKMAEYLCGGLDKEKMRIDRTETIDVRKVDGKEVVNDKQAKIARSAVITFAIKLREDAKPENEGGFVNEDGELRSVITDQVEDEELGYEAGRLNSATAVAYADSEDESGQTREVTIHNDISPEGYFTYQNEYLYFSRLKEESNFVYKNVVEKVKHFDPAFHSITPEGFNARLNFLQQCTRQGPTIGSHAGGEIPKGKESNMTKMAANLAFGMAPYCVLRVGDFFYSKICINAISISYETGGGVQWDLNPEGAGVQPMMADVNITFNFIGGQNLDGPVAQLQNAITSNYYANSSVYTPQSDIVYNKDIEPKI